MKILNLKIIDKEENIIRSIPFAENGISYIYGDIQDPKNKRGTSNSLGKTLLLKLINYIYGSNEDALISKGKLKGYTLEAIIKKDGKESIVSRVIGDSKEIKLNGKSRTLTEYRELLNINRSIYSKQIIINKKGNIIGVNSSANKEDNINFINLINIKKVIGNIEKIYESQDKIKSLKRNRNELISFYDGIDVNKIDEEIYFVDKEVKKLESQIEKVANKIKNIEISDLQENIVEKYSEKSSELKKIKTSIQKLKLERDRLTRFIEDSNKVDITSEHIITIYNKVKVEVPELIQRKLKEVELFHKKVYDERKEYLGKKKNTIDINIIKKESDIVKLSNELDKLGHILSNNQVYQESVELYENFNNELQELKFKEGELSQIKNVDNKIIEEDEKLSESFEKANKEIKEYTEIIEKYREFIFDITKYIYDENVNSYFDIRIRKKHLKNRPLDIEFNLKGDTGEGVNEVKKNIIDYLIFTYNDMIELLIQDSSCYNGIDPRQVCGLLKKLDMNALKVNKQAIISINKYQLGENKEFINEVVSKSSIILSERDKLLKFDF